MKMIPRTSEGAIACIACTKLTRNPHDESATNLQEYDYDHNHVDLRRLGMLTRVNSSDGIEKCCVYNSEQMSAMLELVIEIETQSRDHAYGYKLEDVNISSSPVSAHKRLYPPIEFDNLTAPYFEVKKHVGLHFSNEIDHLVEHVRNVKILKEGFQISHSGLYFVYNSIYFRHNFPRPCRDFKFQTWGHYVKKIVINYPVRSATILRALHTCCRDCVNEYETSFIGGVFNLQKGNIIQVLISGHGLVSFEKESSFAGLVMMT